MNNKGLAFYYTWVAIKNIFYVGVIYGVWNYVIMSGEAILHISLQTAIAIRVLGVVITATSEILTKPKQ